MFEHVAVALEAVTAGTAAEIAPVTVAAEPVVVTTGPAAEFAVVAATEPEAGSVPESVAESAAESAAATVAVAEAGAGPVAVIAALGAGFAVG